MRENAQVPKKLRRELDKLETAALEAAERLRHASEDIADKVLALETRIQEMVTPAMARKRLRAVEGELKALRKASKRCFAALDKSAGRQEKSVARTARRVSKILTKNNAETRTPGPIP